MKTKEKIKRRKGKYYSVYKKAEWLEVGQRMFVQFEYTDSAGRFQDAFYLWCKKNYPDRSYKTYRYELRNPLILEIRRTK